MSYRTIHITGAALILLLLASLGNALDIPSELSEGRVFGASISKSDYDTLVEFAKAPRTEMSRQVLDIIKRAYPDSTLERIGSGEHFIIFLAVGGLNQIVYIHEYTHKAFFIRFKKGFCDPGDIRMFARDIFAIWITDSADDFLTSVEIDISKLTRSLQLTSFESPAPIREYINEDGNKKEIEIGIKHFKIPFHPASIALTFVRRDLDTYERRTWSRSYRVLRPVTFFGEFNIGIGMFIPISDADLKRYEIESNVIKRKDFDETVFLTVGLDWSARRDLKHFGSFTGLLLPDFFMGIGVPVDLKKMDNNSWILGYSWPISSDLIKISLALHLPGENSLSEGYSAGDTVSDLDANFAIEETELTWIMGLSISFNSIGNLF
ncbi:MAG: hypothetical protein V3V99_15200 [candidate division Zixibacteria bacterium]